MQIFRKRESDELSPQNPYLMQPGYWERVTYAVGALHSLAGNPHCREPVQARSFDTCFAMRDGNAVVWELVNRVVEGDVALGRGIAILGPNTWADWLKIYGAPAYSEQISSSLSAQSGERPVSPPDLASNSARPNRGSNFD